MTYSCFLQQRKSACILFLQCYWRCYKLPTLNDAGLEILAVLPLTRDKITLDHVGSCSASQHADWGGPTDTTGSESMTGPVAGSIH